MLRGNVICPLYLGISMGRKKGGTGVGCRERYLEKMGSYMSEKTF
jgi:hypothetical protein